MSFSDSKGKISISPTDSALTNSYKSYSIREKSLELQKGICNKVADYQASMYPKCIARMGKISIDSLEE